jgi:hypothetical protein
MYLLHSIPETQPADGKDEENPTSVQMKDKQSKKKTLFGYTNPKSASGDVMTGMYRAREISQL